MTLAIRRVEPDELAALVALCAEHASFERASYAGAGKPERLYQAIFGREPTLTAWLALLDGQPVGYATAVCNFSTWNADYYLELDCLFVRPGHRNGGIGLALFKAVCAHGQARDLSEMQWQTPVWNEPACRFYERLGGLGRPKIRFVLTHP